MNFVIDLCLCLCGSVAESIGASAESDRLRFDSSWELRMFSLSHARDEMIKTSFSTFEVLSKLAFKTAHVCTSKTFLLIKLFYYYYFFFFNFKAKRFENFICQATLFSYPTRN